MGIYPITEKKDVVTHPDGSVTWVEVYDDFSGRLRFQYGRLEAPTYGDWKYCHCCSCGEREGSDPYCRNHGGTYGERPCEKHNQPGSLIEDSDRMPASVQVERERQVQRRNGVKWE